MARDLVAEITEVQARRGGKLIASNYDAKGLKYKLERGDLDSALDLIPARLVTHLEVANRSWVARLVDYGGQYLERAEPLLRNGVKIDYSLAIALTGQRISVGEFVSHGLSMNRIEDLEAPLSLLLGKSFFSSLVDIRDRFAIEILNDVDEPIIADMDQVKISLTELLKRRHILVHEMAKLSDVSKDEVQSWATAVDCVITAGDELIETTIRGRYPITMQDMKNTAFEDSRKVDERLIETFSRVIEIDWNRPGAKASQAAWEAYRETTAQWRSGAGDPINGTMAELLYQSEWQQLTEDRIKELDAFIAFRADL